MNPLRALDQDDRVMSGAVLTTFPFSAQFFEQAVLPALRDKSIGDRVAVLMDDGHYGKLHSPTNEHRGLNKYEPQYLGQRYHLSPISAGPNRAFHPKIHLLTGDRRVQLIIGSANLTHPGMTSNQEIATRLEIAAPDDEDTPGDSERFTRGEKATLFRGVRTFFSDLINTSLGHSIDAATAATISETLEAGSWVDDIEQPAVDERQTFFLHSLERPILEQVRNRIHSRGDSIAKVDIVAPFFGTSLRVPERFTTDGIDTQLWLQQGRAQIDIEKLGTWLKGPHSAAYCFESTRYLHGKLLVLKTDNAVYCLSGSQNASYAALLTSAGDGGGNVEAAVLRRIPDPDHFKYLFNHQPFTTAEQLDVDTFEPATDLGFFEPNEEPENANSAGQLELHTVSYTRSGTYDGGHLTVRGKTSEARRDVINEEDATLVVSNADSVSTTTLNAHRFEWESTTEGNLFEYTTDLFGDQAQKPYIKPGTATLRVGDSESNVRWVQTKSPTGGGPIPEDIADAGAKAVATSIPGLVDADVEERRQIFSRLNALLSALHQQDVSDLDSSGDRPVQDQPRGGLRISPWTQSRASSPENLISKFFRGWTEDLKEYVRSVSAEHYFAEDVGIRLEGINNTALLVLLLREVRGGGAVPTQPALSVIDDVYKKLNHGERHSLVANYCYNIRPIANRSDEQSTSVYSAVQQNVLPHVIVAAIISEAHIAGDRETYFRQQHWAFEGLIGDCFAAGYPEPEHLTDAFIDDLVTTIQEATAGVRRQLEESRRYRRYADSRYMDEKQLRSAIIELLARSILFDGSNGIKAYRADPVFEAQIERVFEMFVEYLPRGQRREVEQVL